MLVDLARWIHQRESENGEFDESFARLVVEGQIVFAVVESIQRISVRRLWRMLWKRVVMHTNIEIKPNEKIQRFQSDLLDFSVILFRSFPFRSKIVYCFCLLRTETEILINCNPRSVSVTNYYWLCGNMALEATCWNYKLVFRLVKLYY